MIICGIDQSLTSTALVIFNLNSEEVLATYLIKTKNKDTKLKTEYPKEERIKSIRDEVEIILKKHSVEYVFLEGLSLNNKNSRSARDLAGLFYSLIILCLDNFIPYEFYPPTTVKAFACKGNSSKEEVFSKIPEEVREMFNKIKAKKTTGLYDLSDAYFIGKLGIFKFKSQFS
jgi:Holliday junction resolvasome RuvABC endonuclease subunit